MDATLASTVENLVGRVSGPMKFRLVLQPGMAAFLAIRSGLKDAHAGNPAYFWSLFTDPAQRRAMLHDGWKSIRNVFIVAVAIDVIYQLYELHTLYPKEAILVAIILTVIPYLVVRGPTNRVAGLLRNKLPGVASVEPISQKKK